MIILIPLALLILQTQFLIAEIIAVNNDYVMMATADLKEFIKDSEELRILKENQPRPRLQYYIGGNAGTYGAGISAGVIF